MKTDRQKLYRHIGEALRREREKAGLTQAQLAKAVNLQRTSVTNVESGAQQPPLHVLYDLCFEMKIDISELLPASQKVAEVAVVPVTVNQQTLSVPPRAAEMLQGMERALVERAGKQNPRNNE